MNLAFRELDEKPQHGKNRKRRRPVLNTEGPLVAD